MARAQNWVREIYVSQWTPELLRPKHAPPPPQKLRVRVCSCKKRLTFWFHIACNFCSLQMPAVIIFRLTFIPASIGCESHEWQNNELPLRATLKIAPHWRGGPSVVVWNSQHWLKNKHNFALEGNDLWYPRYSADICHPILGVWHPGWHESSSISIAIQTRQSLYDICHPHDLTLQRDELILCNRKRLIARPILIVSRPTFLPLQISNSWAVYGTWRADRWTGLLLAVAID